MVEFAIGASIAVGTVTWALCMIAKGVGKCLDDMSQFNEVSRDDD